MPKLWKRDTLHFPPPRPPLRPNTMLKVRKKNYWYMGTALYVGWGGVGMGMRRFKNAQQM